MKTISLVNHPRYPDLAVDMSFHPIVNSNPRHLTREQIQSFNENGYLLGLPLFSTAETDRLLAYFEGPLVQRIKAFADKKVVGYHHLIPELYALVTNPLLLGYLTDLLGPNVICQVTEYVCKRPNDGWVSPYHQDASFNPLSRAGSVIVWLALAAVDEGNGCMRFVHGSHQRGHLPCRGDSEKPRFGVIDHEKYGPMVSAELNAGEVVIFSDLLVHGAPVNPSPTRLRPGFTMSFCSADVVPYKDWDHMSVLCCGTDRQQNWRVNPQPASV